MINPIFTPKDHYSFEWLDVTAPTQEDYQFLSEKYKLHKSAVKDCLSPSHLPKFEVIDGVKFIIGRVFDISSPPEADTPQQLTNKVAIFISEKFLITIHRREEPFLSKIIKKWKKNSSNEDRSQQYLVNSILDGIIHSFDEVMNKTTLELDELENKIFAGTKDPHIIKSIFIAKRRAAVFKRILFLTKETIERYVKLSGQQTPYDIDLLENAETAYIESEDLYENAKSLLDFHLSLSSHRSNEITTFLTTVTGFFLPLTFIVGLYGMNFDNMPELHYRYGYLGVWIVMICIVIGVFFWFKNKGWI
ncbi:MAG: hypothetical protein NZM38_06965 [Cytophagales bacterium]|nr:hypothetical protein [Cytophagales bacterium]MDW8384497.1 CorA family divalent cation transporter [Flammeovirgaceae bacterium]